MEYYSSSTAFALLAADPERFTHEKGLSSFLPQIVGRNAAQLFLFFCSSVRQIIADYRMYAYDTRYHTPGAIICASNYYHRVRFPVTGVLSHAVRVIKCSLRGGVIKQVVWWLFRVRAGTWGIDKNGV